MYEKRLRLGIFLGIYFRLRQARKARSPENTPLQRLKRCMPPRLLGKGGKSTRKGSPQDNTQDLPSYLTSFLFLLFRHTNGGEEGRGEGLGGRG